MPSRRLSTSIVVAVLLFADTVAARFHLRAPYREVSKEDKKNARKRQVVIDVDNSSKEQKHQESNGNAPPPYRLRKHGEEGKGANNESENNFQPSFDFVIAGFPKCGTTTLLKQFFAHEETDMASTEQCAISAPGLADHIVRRKLDETLSTLSKEPSVKRAFKCPTGMYNYKSIVRMEAHSPNAKFIVGMRHPVKMLQSFYNYRITEINERGLNETIPSLHDVVASGEPWKGVSLEATRFEMFLLQLGKTHVTPEQFEDLVGRQYQLAVKPTKFKVFLYTVDQLEDADETRSKALRDEMQAFLGLTQPIEPFGHENKNHHEAGKSTIKELINICDAEFAEIRHVLTQQGEKTAAWLRNELIQSKDIVIANREHFVQTLESWKVDPCEPVTSS